MGCGWLGLPVAKQLIAAGYTVKGTTTTPEKLKILEGNGIQAQLMALMPEPNGDLSDLLDTDLLLVDVPPKAGKFGDDFHPEQMRFLADAVAQSRVGWVIYISSTSVYPELNRAMLEEEVTTPEQSAAPALVQAEQIWLAQAPERAVTILRCGGLMGYDRIPGKYVAGRTVTSGHVPVNYLHRDDAIGLIRAVIDQQLTGVFNAVAPEHPSRESVYIKSCKQFGYPLPTISAPETTIPFKIINAQKICTATNYVFKYANPLNFHYE